MLMRRVFAAAAVLGVLSLSSAGWSQPARQAPPAAEPAVPAAPSKVVATKTGQVRGNLVGEVETFLGIPYAAPPVGDLRWKPPQPAARWSGVRDATQPGANCNTPNANPNEDCLFLNIYRPANAAPNARLPVMVWIHGGSFTGGSGMQGFGQIHDGTEFAKKGVIVVTINYRLGRAGWFAHPALAKEGPTGNYGLMDQVHSLKWVRDNISAFGGNPRNVTIFGESAGAISVLLLMNAPDARGLFHKAISESGFPRLVPQPLQTAFDFSTKAAAAAGITGDGPEAAAALRKMPLTAFPASSGTSDLTRPYPILDGRLIRGGIVEEFEKGRQAKVPLMIGGNSNEASLFRPTAADLDAITDRKDALLAAFDPGNTGNKLLAINDYVTAQRMTEPNRQAARVHAKAGQPTYVYYFSYVPEAQKARKPYGAGHVDEINYVFASAPARANDQDRAIANAMNAYWAAFAKTGNPGSAGGPAWPKYDPARDPTIEFGNDGVNVRERFQAQRLDYVLQGIR